MSHLPEALSRIADSDPSIRHIRRVPVGVVVKYFGRVGSMRQGRTEFPAFVLKQHPDDGTLDLLVFFEAEDMIWEQRVSPWSETNPGHSWAPVEEMEGNNETVSRLITEVMLLGDTLGKLRTQMYGDYNPPDKSMIEYLDDFDKRLTALEAKLRK
jgi:hypothetical protein